MRRHAIRGIGRRLLNGLAVIIGGFAGAIAVTFAAMFAFQETMGAAVAVLVSGRCQLLPWDLSGSHADRGAKVAADRRASEMSHVHEREPRSKTARTALAGTPASARPAD